jgi:hypothetical protein
MSDAELDQIRHDGAFLRSIVGRRSDLKRVGHEWKCRCPLPDHDDQDASFTVYDDGHFHCYGCGAHGSVIDFFIKCERLDTAEAIRRAAVEYGLDAPRPKPKPNGPDDKEVWQPIVPPPPGAPRPSDQQLACDMLHEYYDADGRLICYVRRHEAKNGQRKQFYPLTYGTLNGKVGWHDRAPNTPRSLYRLNALSHAPADATVILCEGEKKADAVQRMLPDMVGMSWMGGANADGNADLSPLQRRKLILWADADELGRAAMKRIAKRLPQARIVDTSDLADGFDAWDLEQQGCDEPEAWLQARLREPEPEARPEPEPTPAPEPDEISLADLEHEVIQPLLWIVPEYLPEGLTVLAGKPKIGKSWLMLNVALAVARGTEALGKFVEQGDVLYCGLEDGKRRMQARVRHILGPANKNWPNNFSFRRNLAPLDLGGLETLEEWCIKHPNRRLIVIDVLGKVRGQKARNEEPYQYDYRLMSMLQQLAMRYRIAVVIVHHVRKSDAEDVLDTISGTTGIAGAADLALVLGKTKLGCRLAGRGRDTEDIDKLCELDPDTGIWSITGEYDEAAPDSAMGALRRLIRELLDGSPLPLTSAAIATRLGKSSGTVRKVLSRMVKDGQAVKNSDGSFTSPKRQTESYN